MSPAWMKLACICLCVPVCVRVWASMLAYCGWVFHSERLLWWSFYMANTIYIYTCRFLEQIFDLKLFCLFLPLVHKASCVSSDRVDEYVPIWCLIVFCINVLHAVNPIMRSMNFILRANSLQCILQYFEQAFRRFRLMVQQSTMQRTPCGSVKNSEAHTPTYNYYIHGKIQEKNWCK